MILERSEQIFEDRFRDIDCLHADIERVCTHSRFRRRGFARAVIQDCLYRLQDLGMRNAYLTGYDPEAINLYRSLGAAEERQCFVYQRM